MKEYLNNFVDVEIKKKSITIIAASFYRISLPSNELIDFFVQIRKGISIEVAGKNLEVVEYNKIYSFLKGKNLIGRLENPYKETFLEKQYNYFNACNIDPAVAQEKINNIRVAVLGCGGVGNVVVQHLVACGVNNFTLIDYDTVEISNFNRQLCFEQDDLYKNKTQALENYILKKNPAAKIMCHNKKIDNIRDLESLNISTNFFVCCADETAKILHDCVTKFYVNREIPVIFSGVGINKAIIGPLINNKISAANYIELLASNITQSARIVSASISFTNSLVGVLISKSIVEYISGLKQPDCLNKVIGIDLDSLLTEVVKDLEFS